MVSSLHQKSDKDGYLINVLRSQELNSQEGIKERKSLLFNTSHNKH